jgi:hypothetical protein
MAREAERSSSVLGKKGRNAKGRATLAGGPRPLGADDADYPAVVATEASPLREVEPS